MNGAESIYGKRVGGIGLKRDYVLEFFRQMPDHGIEEIAGREDLKKELKELSEICIAEAPGCPGGVLFTGAVGSAKHWVSDAFAHAMMAAKGYRMLYAAADDIIRGPDPDMAGMILDAFFYEAAEHAPCILRIGMIERFCEDPRLMELFFGKCRELWEQPLTQTHGKHILLVGITSHPDLIDPGLRQHMREIHVPLPDAEERRAYFAACFTGVAMEDGFTFDDMSARTEGCNYYSLFTIFEKILRERNRHERAHGEAEFRITSEMFERAAM